MPKVILQPMIVQIQGTMIVTKRPDMSNVTWSKAQLAHRQRFKQAVVHVKAALAEPKVRARYERQAKKQNKRAWDLAMSDYFQGRDLHTGK